MRKDPNQTEHSYLVYQNEGQSPVTQVKAVLEKG